MITREEADKIPQLKGKEYFFYKKNPTDKIYWVEYIDTIGQLAISFDKKEILNLWQDYPHKFTPEQKGLFDKENPYWRDFFKDRSGNK